MKCIFIMRMWTTMMVSCCRTWYTSGTTRKKEISLVAQAQIWGPPSSFSQACSKVIRLEMLQCLHFSFDFCKPVKFFYLGKLKKTFLQRKSMDFLMTHFLIYFSEANEVLENLVSKLLLKSNLLVKSFSFSPYFVGRQNRDFRHLLGR